MDNRVEVLILAGGLGTRLKSISGDIPKPMMPINGKPFIQILIDKLNKLDFHNINISISYNPEYFLNYFKDSEINFIIENEALGTGGAIKYAVSKMNEFDYLLVLNGDTLFDIDYNQMLFKHKINDADITIASKIMEKPYRYGTLEIGNNRITRFKEKEEIPSGVINCGIYLINRSALTSLPNQNKFSFETEFLEKSTSNLKIIPYVSDVYFIDIGIPEDYNKANEYLK